jgi:endo-1,4-beta-D-glucanase Y
VEALLLSQSLEAQPRRPFPQHTSYAAGTISLDRRTQEQQDDDVRAYYDVWKSNFLVPAGNESDGTTLYRITAGRLDPSRTVSEGQGYGMMIVAWMAGHDPAAQTLFDGLWRFARKYPSSIDSRLMSFEVPFDPANFNSAFDGDCDIAYALLLADAQWGSGQAVNYRADALTVIAGILESTIGPDSRLPMLGDWVKAGGQRFNQYTPRSSDFMLDHFRAFQRATGDAVWTRVIEETQAVIGSLQEHYSPDTGLLPDFIVPTSDPDHTPKPAPPNFLEAPTDGEYSYNAGRVPWRLGVDALLSGDPVSMAQTRKITRWIAAATGGNPYEICSGYELDGKPFNDFGFTVFFTAPFGAAAMTEPSQQEWLDQIYDSVYARHEDYYEDSVTLLCLLVMTHNTWSPSVTKRLAVGLS